MVGSHEIETKRGISLGRVAKPLLSMARCAIFIARRPPDLALFDVVDLTAGGSPRATIAAARLAAGHGSEIRTILPGTAATAAAAIGCGLVVTGDGAEGARIAREAPCSVLIVRERH